MSPEAFKAQQARLGMKGKELAEVLDVSQETISRWRQGKQPIPRVVMLAMMALG